MLNSTHPQMVLAVCPIHRNVVLADGSAHPVTASRLRESAETEAGGQSPLEKSR